MNYIEIKRPTQKDVLELSHFFKTVITHTFEKEGIGHLLEDIEQEINSKIEYLKMDLESKGVNRYFYIAQHNEKVVGTIEHGSANKLIIENTKGEYKDQDEVGTVFVHPDYQGKGIGNLLLNVMFIAMQNKGIKKFCLDSGYPTAQKIWEKKFGKPDYVLKDFWGTGNDHMIWSRRIDEIPINFKA